MRTILAASSLATLSVLLFASDVAAQGYPYSCGPVCSQPGRRILCNDSIPDQGMTQLNCGASLGSCQGERVCATFAPEDGSYPAYLTRVWAIYGPLAAGQQFDLEVYQESNMAAPGVQIADTLPNSYQIGGDPTRWTQIDLTTAGDQYKINDGAFRICIRKQFDVSHNVCYDTDDTQPSGQMWMWAGLDGDILSGNPDNYPCTDPLLALSWADASSLGITGDFAIRAEVIGTDTADWEVGGACYVPGSDAGVGGSDAGEGEGEGEGEGDAGTNVGGIDGGGEGEGEGEGEGDAGIGEGEGEGEGEGDAGPQPPPAITSVTPDEGRVDIPTDVIVSGTGFQSGLTLRIGTIPADDVVVSGSTTIDATVPANIAAGTYDVVVRNPDNQVSVLPDGFTIIDPGALGQGDGGTGTPVGPNPNDGATAPGGCDCRSSGAPDGGAALAVLIGLALYWRRRRRA
jgi:MYXO-CTERM domain-containing protein